jgi:hypothetical protein
MTQDEYYDRLRACQNKMALHGIPVDIMSITALLNEKEKLKHLEFYEKEVKKL